MERIANPLEYYRKKELDVFPTIPGMRELLGASEENLEEMEEKYPDAVFALMTASDILSGDRERNAINQQAYFEILQGRNIADVRRRHSRAMDKYLRQHMWDD